MRNEKRTKKERKRIRAPLQALEFVEKRMIISIDGNFGAGTTSIIDAISKNVAVNSVADVHATSARSYAGTLDRFRNASQTYACLLALDVLAGLASVRAAEDRHAVVKRSPLSVLDVHVRANAQDNLIGREQLALITEYAATYAAWRPDVIVFVEAPVTECMRAGEFEFVKYVGFLYDRALKEWERAGVRVIRVRRNESEGVDAFSARVSYLVQQQLASMLEQPGR